MIASPFMKTHLLVTVLILCGPDFALAQAPAAYEAAAQGRLLTCYGSAYALVELVDVSTKNLALVKAETRRVGTEARPGVAAGLALSGSQVDQWQALDMAERIEQCVGRVLGQVSVPDAAMVFTARALQEEIGIAINFADTFTSDFNEGASALDDFFARATDAAAQTAPTKSFRTFGDDVKAILQRARSLLTDLAGRTEPR